MEFGGRWISAKLTARNSKRGFQWSCVHFRCFSMGRGGVAGGVTLFFAAVVGGLRAAAGARVVLIIYIG